jgi:hypothetical protein
MEEHKLEGPGDDDAPDWDSLYRARGDEVSSFRPVFTGDVFFGVNLIAQNQPEDVIVLQHPCAIRKDGLTLWPALLVAELSTSAEVKPSQWLGNYRWMPLTRLKLDKKPHHYTGYFHKLHLVEAAELSVEKRVACMSQVGVNLVMQRWVNHNTRVVIPTFEYQKMSAPQFEESDLIEDWCFEREADAVPPEVAMHEIDTWLSEQDASSSSRRDRLVDEQQRSQIRQDQRSYLRRVRG